MIKKLLAFILVVIISFPVSSQKKKLAVLDPVIAGEKLTEGLAISVREIVSSSFVNNADNYAIVERSLIDKVIQEAKFSNSDAVDESQATQLGKLAGADKVVLTVISRFDNRCMMSIKLIDVESATIDRQISKLVDLSSLLDVTEPLTLAVLGKGDGSVDTSAPKTTSSQIRHPQNSQNHRSSNNGSEFNGSGVSFESLGYDIPMQPEDFLFANMGKIYLTPNYNVIIDLSDANVMGMDLKTYIETSTDGRGHKNIESEANRVLEPLNKIKGHNFTYNPALPITLVIKVRELDKDGRENTSDYVFIDNTTNEVLCGIRLKSKGGRFGSFANLFGDALEEDAAPRFVKKFNAAIKKFNK